MALVEDVDSVCGMFPRAGSVLNEWQLMNTSSETSVRLFSGGWQENKWMGARGGQQKKMRTQRGAVTPPTCSGDPCHRTGRSKRACAERWRWILVIRYISFSVLQPQRSEAWESATRRKEQHQDSRLRHGLPSGRGQSAGNQLWVCRDPPFSDVLVCYNVVTKKCDIQLLR